MPRGTPVSLRLVDGVSIHSATVSQEADSIFVHAVGHTIAIHWESVVSMTYPTTRKLDPHWSIVGFGIGYIAGSWAAGSDRFGAPLVGLFGGLIGAAAGGLLPPLQVPDEKTVACTPFSPE